MRSSRTSPSAPRSRRTPETVGSDSFDLGLLDLLHAIRLRGLIEVTESSRPTSSGLQGIDGLLDRALATGLIVRPVNRSSRWFLTDLGRVEHDRMISAEVDRLGIRGELDEAFEHFIPINTKVLSVCTAWQVVTVGSTTIPNDHSDAAHDRAVLRRFDDLHRRALPLVRRLGQLSPRFSGYDGRLTMAHERISAGETGWLTLPTVDSYHSIWFELHENLLANLGRERSDGRTS